MKRSSIDEFIPLARVILGDSYGGNQHALWVLPLAQLLDAASRGRGQLPLSECTPAEGYPPYIFQVNGDRVSLARNAALLSEVRVALYGLLSETPFEAPEEPLRLALSNIVPFSEVRDTLGRVLVNNNDQREAIAALITKRVGVLTGGPGTGKTTVAAALLAVRKRLYPALRPSDVLLCAPTGKAACRLEQSMRASAQRLQLSDAERAFLLELEALTLHRALEWTPREPEHGGPFRRGRARPLQHEVLVLDEASMVDLNLAAHLFRALGPRACLYVLGDTDQLESVEAGGVLAELVALGSAPSPSQSRCPPSNAAMSTTANRWPGLTVHLRQSFRAKSAPWILQLARIAKPETVSSAAQFVACCQDNKDHLGLHFRRNSFAEVCQNEWLTALHWASLLSLQTPPTDQQLLEQLGTFQLLCADNAQVERANRAGVQLFWNGKRPRGVYGLPHGCPVLVTRNRYSLGLANGDVGIALGDSAGQEAAAVVFPGIATPISVTQLSDAQPAFGMTIHKSQGSEWSHVAIDWPDRHEMLTRSLLYTAITRSSNNLNLHVSGHQALESVLQGGT